MSIVVSFDGEERFLSNFFPASTRYEGITYPTSEHAFHAAKTLHLPTRFNIKDAPTPGQAKKMGRYLELRPGWDGMRVAVMSRLVYDKFARNTELRKLLLATGDDILVEGNTWRDFFWGAMWMTSEDPTMKTWAWDRNSPLVGHNNLGIILMQTRESFR